MTKGKVLNLQGVVVNNPFSPRPQAHFPPTVVCDVLPIQGDALRFEPGAAWTVLAPGVPPISGDFRTRVRSLRGFHLAAIGAHDNVAPVGPEAFDAKVMRWLIRTADTLIVWGSGFNGESKQEVESILRPARRAFLVMTVPEYQWAWYRAVSAHACKGQSIHPLMWEATAFLARLDREAEVLAPERQEARVVAA